MDWSTVSDIGSSLVRSFTVDVPVFHVERELVARLKDQARSICVDIVSMPIDDVAEGAIFEGSFPSAAQAVVEIADRRGMAIIVVRFVQEACGSGVLFEIVQAFGDFLAGPRQALMDDARAGSGLRQRDLLDRNASLACQGLWIVEKHQIVREHDDLTYGSLFGHPVKLSVELPAAVHRDLVAYAVALAAETGGSPAVPEKLVAPMLARFMAADHAFTKAQRQGHVPQRQRVTNIQHHRHADHLG